MDDDELLLVVGTFLGVTLLALGTAVLIHTVLF